MQKTTMLLKMFGLPVAVGLCFPALSAEIDGLSVGEGQTVTVNATDTATHAGQIWGTLNNYGITSLDSFADLFGTLNNYGLLITKDITHNGKTINHAGGHIVMTGYIDMYSTNSLFDNAGKVSVINAIGDGGNVGSNAPFTYLFRGPINNSGTFLIDRGSNQNVCPQSGIGTITNSGLFEIAKNTLCDFAARPATDYARATYIQTAGETRVNGTFSAHSLDLRGGTVSGSGSVKNIETFMPSQVTVAPGAPLGTLNLTPIGGGGEFFCMQCTIEIELGGASGNDLLKVNSEFYLHNEKISVVLRNGFVPKRGDSFTVITANYMLEYGSPPIYLLPQLPGGLTWNVAVSDTAMTLTVN
jgi:hypothetical protein